MCGWLGNSEDVARKHYLQTTDAHFSRAADSSAGGKQNPKQQAPAPIAVNSNSETAIAQKPKQNPKRLVAVWSGGDSHSERYNCAFAEKNDTLRDPAEYKADGEGFEPPVPLPVRRFSRPLP